MLLLGFWGVSLNAHSSFFVFNLSNPLANIFFQLYFMSSMDRKICPDCLSNYKRSTLGKRNRKLGVSWGSGQWVEWVYHTEKTRKCLKHHTQGLVDGAKRRAVKINASPAWSNKSKIKQVYLERLEKTTQELIAYEVDHIVPLRGKNVCGLHNEFNLQIISATENRKKSNKF